jgi:hypothetical protein
MPPKLGCPCCCRGPLCTADAPWASIMLRTTAPTAAAALSAAFRLPEVALFHARQRLQPCTPGLRLRPPLYAVHQNWPTCHRDYVARVHGLGARAPTVHVLSAQAASILSPMRPNLSNPLHHQRMLATVTDASTMIDVSLAGVPKRRESNNTFARLRIHSSAHPSPHCKGCALHHQAHRLLCQPECKARPPPEIALRLQRATRSSTTTTERDPRSSGDVLHRFYNLLF